MPRSPGRYGTTLDNNPPVLDQIKLIELDQEITAVRRVFLEVVQNLPITRDKKTL
jgi:hypothetical protein